MARDSGTTIHDNRVQYIKALRHHKRHCLTMSTHIILTINLFLPLRLWRLFISCVCALQLPDDAHLRCSGKVFILIQGLRLWPVSRTHASLFSSKISNNIHERHLSTSTGGRRLVSEFKSRDELIDCLLGATHVPFLMDWKPFRDLKQKK